MLHFYTLLYIDTQKSLSSNISSTAFEDQIKTYCMCCKTLLHSLNYKLTVLTNNVEFLKEYLPSKYLLEIPFSLNPPHDICFYAAHFKLDVYKYLGENAPNYSIVIDNDIICNNKLPDSLAYCIKKDIPSFYNISDQIHPAEGSKRIIEDKILITGEESIGLWAGGEYLGGDCHFYKKLSQEIDTLLPAYFNNFKNLHHQGDEFVTSCALEKMMQNGLYIADIGPYGVIGRFWSVTPLHIQKDIMAYKDTYLLHLPYDKEYLAKWSGSDFFSDYSLYIRKKIKNNKIKKIIKYFIPPIIRGIFKKYQNKK